VECFVGKYLFIYNALIGDSFVIAFHAHHVHYISCNIYSKVTFRLIHVFATSSCNRLLKMYQAIEMLLAFAGFGHVYLGAVC